MRVFESASSYATGGLVRVDLERPDEFRGIETGESHSFDYPFLFIWRDLMSSEGLKL